jgi:hypothetical protein
MNQGYLTSWLARYPSVHAIRHPGVNLAYWNIARHEITETPVLSVDGEALIFHHFSNLHQDGRGYWHCPHRKLGANLEVTLRAIYRPYLEEVEATADELRRRIPGCWRPIPRPDSRPCLSWATPGDSAASLIANGFRRSIAAI